MNYKQLLVRLFEEDDYFDEYAIGFCLEGNRREGRRPSYAFEYSSPPQIMPPPPPPPPASSSASAFLTSSLTHRSCRKCVCKRERETFVCSSGS